MQPFPGPILITGASGFLGGHVLAQARARGAEVRALLRRDSPERDAKAAWLASQGAEIVEGDLHGERALRHACRDLWGLVHCAALLGNWSRQNHRQYHVNVDGTAALMRVALERRVPRVVHVSSIAAIGASRTPTPMDERQPWSWTARPKLHYAKTKREAEERCLHALRDGLPAIVVNPAGMLGRSARGAPLRGLCVAARAGRPHRLMRGGASFAWVPDVAASVLAALERGRVGERYVLGGANATWSGFYETAARLHGEARRHPTWPDALGRVLAGATTALDLAGLTRPSWAPERFRIWGWYGWADSTKAVRELGHVVRDLPEVLRRAYELPEE